jgi:hypothetical protein
MRACGASYNEDSIQNPGNPIFIEFSALGLKREPHFPELRFEVPIPSLALEGTLSRKESVLFHAHGEILVVEAPNLLPNRRPVAMRRR